MPTFGTAINTSRVPVLGLVAETSATAPANPKPGQQWTDTSVTPRVVRVWDGTAWIAANRYFGTTAGTMAEGNDTRIVGAAQKANNLSDLVDFVAARTNLGLGGAAVLNVGTGANTVAAGDDARLTDALLGANNLSDVDDKPTARTNLGLGNSATRDVGTTGTTVAAGNDSRITGAAQKSANLSDLGDLPTARTNLGLGNAATRNVGDAAGTVAAGDDARILSALQPTGNLAGLDNYSTARDNLGLKGAAVLDVGTVAGTVAAGNDSRITGAAQKSANLSDLGSATTARTNLGLGDSATRNVGATAGTVAAGDDGRITGAAQKSANLSDLASASTARTNLGLGTAATANTGTGATDVILGSDARLSDARAPIAGSVTNASVATNAAIDESKLSLASDAAAGTASRRTLSVTSTTAAMPGGTRLDQIATSNPATAAITANSQRITNLGAPTQASDAARLADVQAAASGIDSKPSVRVATTAAITLSGAQTIDGVAVVAGDRVLVKNQADATANGPYVVAAGAWTRATDTLTPNSFWFVEEGTQGDTQWVLTNNGTITPGTTALTITQFGAPNVYSAGAGLALTGNTFSISGTYAGQTSITTVGTLTAGTWNASTIALGYGGTGATTAAGARTNLGVAQKGYSTDLGALTAGGTVTVTHNLGTQDVVTQVRDTSTNEVIFLDVINSSANVVTIRSDVAFAAGALRAVVVPAV